MLPGSNNPADYPGWESDLFHFENAPYNAKCLIAAENEENIMIKPFQNSRAGEVGFNRYLLGMAVSRRSSILAMERGGRMIVLLFSVRGRLFMGE